MYDKHIFFRHHFNMFILVAFSQETLPVSTSQALLRRMVAQDAAGRASEALQDSGFGCDYLDVNKGWHL